MGTLLGLLLGPLTLSPGGAAAWAAPRDGNHEGSFEANPPAPSDRPLKLGLDAETAMRLAMAEEGAAQESDTEKPRPMDEPRVTVTKVSADGSDAASKKKSSAPAKDRFGFVKDWPFWVIVGGVVITGVAVFMIYRNANQTQPCGSRFNSGCFGEQ